MDNHYIQWSERFILSSKEEADWLHEVLYFDASEYGDNAAKVIKEKFGIEVDSYEAEFFPDFSTEFDSDNEVYIYSDQCGKVDHAVLVFQAFLKKFRPNGYFKIEWTDTCSKLVGGFGGGAVFITADHTQRMSTNTWVSDCVKKFLSN